MKANGPSTGEGVDYKEGINLLDAGSSDSEGQEHFSLPPLNLKGGRKRRKKSAAGGCCSMTCVMTSVCLLALFVGYLGLAYYTWSLGQQLEDLKTSGKSGAGENSGSLEKIETLEKKQKELEESISAVESLPNSVQTHQKNIEDIMKQISKLNSTTSQLAQSLSSGSLQNADQASVSVEVEKSVAQMGSDLKTLQDKVSNLEQFQTDVNSKLEDLTERLSVVEKLQTGADKSDSTPDAEEDMGNGPVSVKKELLVLNQALAALNTSVNTQLVNFNIHLNQHTLAISELHNTSMDLREHLALVELRPATNSPEDQGQRMQELVENAVTAAFSDIQNMTKSEMTDSKSITELKNELNNSTKVISVLEEQFALMQKQQIDLDHAFENMIFVNHTIDELTGKVENYHDHAMASIKETNYSVLALSQSVTNLESRIEVDEKRIGSVENGANKQLLPSEISATESPFVETQPNSPSSTMAPQGSNEAGEDEDSKFATDTGSAILTPTSDGHDDYDYPGANVASGEKEDSDYDEFPTPSEIDSQADARDMGRDASEIPEDQDENSWVNVSEKSPFGDNQDNNWDEHQNSQTEGDSQGSKEAEEDEGQFPMNTDTTSQFESSEQDGTDSSSVFGGQENAESAAEIEPQTDASVARDMESNLPENQEDKTEDESGWVDVPEELEGKTEDENDWIDVPKKTEVDDNTWSKEQDQNNWNVGQNENQQEQNFQPGSDLNEQDDQSQERAWDDSQAIPAVNASASNHTLPQPEMTVEPSVLTTPRVPAQTEPDDNGKGLPEIIHMEGVETYADVQRKFAQWDRDLDNAVTYEEITAAEGGNAPDEDQLKIFDFDNDDKYSFDEISAAFGFSPSSPNPPKERRSVRDDVSEILNMIRQR